MKAEGQEADGQAVRTGGNSEKLVLAPPQSDVTFKQ